MSFQIYQPPQDDWLLIHPTHRYDHMFPMEHETVSECGLPYVHKETNGENYGTYLSMRQKRSNHCPECVRLYAERVEARA